MRLLFGIRRNAPNELVPVGKVKLDTNMIDLDFVDGALARFAEELRPILLLAAASLRAWPLVPPDLLEWKPEACVWANPRGVLKDRRPLVWEGWPLEWGALLRPSVPPEKLAGFASKQSGFLRRLRRERILGSGAEGASV